MKNVCSSFIQYGTRARTIQLKTDDSLESTFLRLDKELSPKIVIVNHEKRLGIDTTCANLAIKYNMIYLSSYQIIKQHITNNTEWGKKLLANQKKKDIILTTQVRDEFNEADYSPVHFDQKVVMDLFVDTIEEKRQTQQNLILLEGFCNSSKLENFSDQLALRFMDEYNLIEKRIGEVIGIIGLQFNYEPEAVKEDDIEYEKFQKKKPVAASPVEGEGGEGGEANAEEAQEEKKPAWSPEDYEWTKTNNKPKNLPQLFIASKGFDHKGASKAAHEVKPADQFSSSQYEAITKSLDEFCLRISQDTKSYIYQQVIFTE